MVDDGKRLTLRLEPEVYRAYKILLIEEGSNVQADLESYVLRRLQDAGKLPTKERGQD